MAGFDLQVHHYDSKGQVTRSSPYRLRISEGKREFERPVNSGVWYAEDGTLLRDESVAIRAAEEARLDAVKAVEDEKLAAAKVIEEAQKAEALEALKAQIRAEIMAEQKAVKHGASTKA